MSIELTPTSISTVTPMGVASEAMVTVASGLCRSILEQKFLVLVDAHSKWLEVMAVSAATSMVTREVTNNFRNTWTTQENQWSSVH